MVVVGLLIGLLAFVIPIAIVVLIITAIVKRNKEDKNNFDETIRNIYVYIVLIVTLVAIIMGVITAFRIGLDVILPEKSASQSSYDNDEMNRNENIIECFTTFSLVVSVIPVFIKHNKLAKEARKIKVEEIKIEESNH